MNVFAEVEWLEEISYFKVYENTLIFSKYPVQMLK